MFSDETKTDEEEVSQAVPLITSMRKSPVLKPALQATPSTSTDSRYWRAGNAGVGVNSSMGVSAEIEYTEETRTEQLSEICSFLSFIFAFSVNEINDHICSGGSELQNFSFSFTKITSFIY